MIRAKRTAKATGAPAVQRKARAHARHDAHERQADARGDAFAQGAMGLGHGLSPAPAAGFADPASPGVPLTATLRQDLEHAFDADLSAVRIHRDPAAWAATRRFGARAFASGHAIYFGQGAYDPASIAGRALIGHELTHILQQTGRATNGPHRLAATLQAGPAPVQCAPTPVDADAETAQRAIFDEMARLHRGGATLTGDAELEAAIDLARDKTGGRLVNDFARPAFSVPLRDATGAAARFKSAKARSFLFDCLKVCGWFPQAATLIAADDDFALRTFAYVTPFLDFLRTETGYGRPWLTPWLSHGLFRPLWPDAILRGWRAFYLRPTYVPDPDKDLVRKGQAIDAQVKAQQFQLPPTLRTEAWYLCWELIGAIERERIAAQLALRTQLLPNGIQAQTIFQSLVAHLPAWREQALKTAEDDAAAGSDRSIAAGQVPLIDEALAYWKKAVADYATWQGRWTLPDDRLSDLDAAFPPARFAAEAAGALRGGFVAAVEALFPSVEDADGQPLLPAPDAYAQALRAFVASLMAQPLPGSARGEPAATWIDRLQAQALAEATASTPDPARLSQTAILPLVFSGLIGLALSYDAKVDQAAPHFDDNRRAHRLRMARVIAAIGHWLGWTDAIGPLAKIFDSLESVAPMAEYGARLMLVSDWEPDAVRPIADMLSDFPERVDAPILEDAPFSLRVIVEWFRYDYHARLREALATLLRAETRLTADTRLDFSTLDQLRQTRSAVRGMMAATADAEFAIEKADRFALKVPQRFILRDFDLVVPKGASLDFFDLLYAHEKTQQQLVRRSHGIILPTKPDGGVFGWLLPPLGGLYQTLLSIQSIAPIVARTAGETDAAWARRLAPQGSGPDAEAQPHLSPEDITRLNSALLAWVRKLGEHEERQIPDMWRRLIILRRRYLSMLLIPRIEAFADNPYVSHGKMGESRAQMAVRLDTPQRIIELMRAFEGSARPLRERTKDQGADAIAAERARVEMSVNIQMALLTFHLAPSLLRIPPETMRWDLKQHLYEYFQLAIDCAEDEAKLGAMRHGLGVDDEAAAEIIPVERRTALVAAMKAFMGAFEREVARSQDQRGYRSEGDGIRPNAERMQHVVPVGRQPGENEWRTNQSIGIDGKLDNETGDKWRLTKIYVAFEYHPGIGTAPPPGMRKGAGGPIAPARLIIGTGAARTEYFAPDLPDISLFQYSFNDRLFEVRANDLYGLEQLDDIFLWRSIQLSMESAALIIETFADWMTTVAAVFFPEVAIAEFVISMAQMLDNGDFDELIAQLKDDPLAFALHAVERISTDLFQASNIWKFVLLGGQHSPLHMLAQHKPAKARKVQPTGKLGKVVAVLRSLGARFEGMMHRVHDYTQPPFRRAQGRVAMHPTLVWLLRKASHFAEAAYDLIPPEVAEGAFFDEFAKLMAAENIEQEFRDRVTELFEGIERIELPGQLVDVAPAIELILSFILSRFGSRGKILRILLSTMPVPDSWAGGGKRASYTTALAFISGHIRDAWVKDSAVDPNLYWKKQVLPLVGDRFNLIRNDLVDGLYQSTDDVLSIMKLPPLKRPTAGELPLAQVVGEPLTSESEASIPDGRHPGQGRPILPAGGGTPLGQASRRRFESQLGADLSHVRIHSNAASVTRPIRAHALTSGSHIYLRPGISPATPAGRHLLGHELTHVVQQTGPRGAGRIGGRVPTLGRPHVGVRFDPQRERIADQVAGFVGRGARVPARLRQGIGRFHGIQPSIEGDVASSILTELSKADAKSFTKDLEGGKDPEGYAAAKALADQILGMIRKKQNLHFARFMEDVVDAKKASDLILVHMTNRMGEIRGFELQIKQVAQLAQKPKHKTSDKDPDTELNPRAFVQLLANYLFATFDVAMKIDTDASVKTIRKIELFGLNIAEIGGTSPLWKAVMKNSFAGTSITDLEKAQREMRERLRAMGPQPNIWNPVHFKFTDRVIADYLEELRIRAEGDLDDMPPVADYVRKDNPKGDGLAIGTHGNLSAPGRRIGTYKRESHHTTQYLLIEFFSNHPEASRKAFPGPVADRHGIYGPAGIHFKGQGLVESIEGAGQPIPVAKFSPTSGRGDAMPAILLSARCHQRGELHILRAGRWKAETDENIGTPSQGFAIENEFHKLLPASLRPSEGNVESVRKTIAHDPMTAKVAYHRAALGTYKWMNDHMMKALREGMLREELAHYRGIAARKHIEADGKTMAPGWDLTVTHLGHVYDEAVRNNDEVMAKWRAS